MPTAGRLAGAVCFAILGAYIAFTTMPYFEEGKVPTYWWPLCCLTGVWAGWVVVGKRTNRGYSAAIGNGITGMAAQVFWILLVVSFVDMIRKSLRKSYDGPLEAVVNVFELGIEHAVTLGQSDVLVGLAVGGVLAGIVTEFFARRLP